MWISGFPSSLGVGQPRFLGVRKSILVFYWNPGFLHLLGFSGFFRFFSDILLGTAIPYFETEYLD